MQAAKRCELPVLAIDLGGTKIIAAIISNQWQVIAREYHLTLADEGPQPVINRILSASAYFANFNSTIGAKRHNIRLLSSTSLYSSLTPLSTYLHNTGLILDEFAAE